MPKFLSEDIVTLEHPFFCYQTEGRVKERDDKDGFILVDVLENNGSRFDWWFHSGLLKLKKCGRLIE